MGTFLCMMVLFLAKVLDNALGTARTILVQRNKPLLAGLSLAVSNFIYFWLTKKIVSADGNAALLIVSIAGGVGCWLAVVVSNRLSKARTHVNVIMSDNKEAMQNLRDFLAEHHITNVAADSYTRDWNTKTITVTAYAETKAQRRLINEYIAQSGCKFKRMVQST